MVFWKPEAYSLAVTLTIDGTPYPEMQKHFEAAFPGQDFDGKFDGSAIILAMINNNQLKYGKLSKEVMDKVHAGRKIIKKVPGGQADQLRAGHKPYVAHMTKATIEFKEINEGKLGGKTAKEVEALRHRYISTTWAVSPDNKHAGDEEWMKKRDNDNDNRKRLLKRRTKERKAKRARLLEEAKEGAATEDSDENDEGGETEEDD